MAKKTVEKYRENALKSFAYFCRLIQDDGYIFPVHIELADFIQNGMEFGNTHRMMVVMPRGSYKTTFATKFFPLWLAVNNPNVRILIVSNTLPNAKQKLAEIRMMIQSNPLVRSLFPYILPDRGNRWSDSSAEINRDATYSECTFEAAGVRSRLTGRHYDWIIEDDTIAPDLDDLQADIVLPSRDDVEQAIGWHKLATPLLVDAYLGGRLVIGTRWCHDDLLDYVGKKEKYSMFSRKAIEDGKPIIGKFRKKALDDIKESLGSYMFSSLYMNDPVRPDDMLFRSEWIHEIPDQFFPENQENTPKEKRLQWVITVDPAISDKTDACETAITRAAHKGDRIYIDNSIAGHWTPNKTVGVIMEMIKQDPDNTRTVGVETVAYQKALALQLRDEMARQGVFVPITEIRSKTDKDVRISGLQPFFERRQIILRKGLKKLVSQLVQYPYGKLIDRVDSLAMQLDCFTGRYKKQEKEEEERPSTDVKLEDVLKQMQRNSDKGIMKKKLGVDEPMLTTGLVR